MGLKWQILIAVFALNSFLFISAQRKNYYRYPYTKATTPRNNLYRSTNTWLNKNKESRPRVTCTQPNGIIPDPVDVYSYKICISRGGNWLVYSYKCPPRTFFNIAVNRCASGTPPTSSTASTIYEITKIVDLPGNESISEVSTGTESLISSTEKTAFSGTSPLSNSNDSSTMSTTMTTAEIESTATMIPSTDSSSSSEEIFLTFPPHFTSRPPPPPLIITGQLSIPSLNEKYHNLQGHPYFTTQSSVSEVGKLTTWQSLDKVSTPAPMPTPKVDSPVRATSQSKEKLNNNLEFLSSFNKFDEKLVHNLITETDQQATRRPTRWKPNLPMSSLPTRERFPHIRPSPQKTSMGAS